MCTHPVPNNLPQPPIGLEVTLERDGFPHNDWRQRLDGNCQISCKKVTKVHTGLWLLWEVIVQKQESKANSLRCTWTGRISACFISICCGMIWFSKAKWPWIIHWGLGGDWLWTAQSLVCGTKFLLRSIKARRYLGWDVREAFWPLCSDRKVCNDRTSFSVENHRRCDLCTLKLLVQLV